MADLKAFAEQLVGLTVKEVNELATILKDEYGIEPAAAAAPVMVAGGAGGGLDSAKAINLIDSDYIGTRVDFTRGEFKTSRSQYTATSNQTVFNHTQDALMFTSRPKFKYIFGGDYEIGKWVWSVNNTVFGPTKFKNADYSDVGLSSNFLTKMVTDLGINYKATDKITLAFSQTPKYMVLSVAVSHAWSAISILRELIFSAFTLSAKKLLGVSSIVPLMKLRL